VSVLEPDTLIRLPAVTVIKASAGSGKTYTLTRRCVQFLLSREIPKNDLRNTLAITFSNNASREMKEKVLEWLKLLSLADAGRTADITSITTGGEQFARRRSTELIEEIFDRYSDFQIRTIDSFMATVFRSSALDFGFSPEFEILLDPDPLIDYAFSLYLRDAREGSERAALLDQVISMVLGFQTEGERFPWDPTRPLLEEMRALEGKLSALEGSVRPVDLSGDMREAEERVLGSLEDLKRQVDASGLEPTVKSTFPASLAAARAGRFGELIAKGMKLAPVKKPSARDRLDAYQRIKAAWEEVDLLVSRYAGLWARSYYLPYLRLHAGLGETLERVKRNQARVFIGDISRRLGEYLAAEIVPEIYFRLGERICHFLIDEFQDTSPIQWRNLFPLIENSLSEGGSLFVVGDTKQAIYGFRQADYTIMRMLETESRFPSARHEVRELEVNYRSRPRIIRLSEEIFKRNAPAMDCYRRAAAASGLDHWTQEARQTEDPGYAEVVVLPRDDEDPPERVKLQSVMRELHVRGYRWGDIALLAPRNEDVLRATSWLNEEQIPFISFSSLDVRRRRISGEIISLLRFLDSPPDDLAFASFILGELFLRCLRREGWPANDPLHLLLFQAREERPLYKSFQRTYPELWGRYFSGLFRSAGYLPLYDLASEIFCVFGMFDLAPEEEAALAKLLETVKDFEGSGSNSLRDFLATASEPTSEAGQWAIDVPREADSVRAMTIHKAKGLGFPVTVVLLYGERAKGFAYTPIRDAQGLGLVKLSREIAARDPELASLYEDEATREKVNRLNALYVALTRAMSELYVIGVKRDGDTYPFDLLPESLFAPKAEKGPARSEPALAEQRAPLLHDIRPIQPSPGRAHLALKERGRGELVHRIFSLIPYADGDLDEKLRQAALRAVREARMEDVEQGLLPSMAKLIRDPRLSPFFERRAGRSVFAEREFSDAAGRLYRMDRLVIDADRVTLLDFKTGTERGAEAEHDEQMRVYAAILEAMYPGKSIEAHLVYTDLGDVRKVT
jgi:ATP-dependent helicase/nuclease subunit A